MVRICCRIGDEFRKKFVIVDNRLIGFVSARLIYPFSARNCWTHSEPASKRPNQIHYNCKQGLAIYHHREGKNMNQWYFENGVIWCNLYYFDKYPYLVEVWNERRILVAEELWSFEAEARHLNATLRGRNLECNSEPNNIVRLSYNREYFVNG